MGTINTRQEFIDYCFRSLGAPVIQVNIDPLQAQDRLDEALEYMYERHFDFNERALFIYQITGADVQNKYFDTTQFGPAMGAQIKTDEEGNTGFWPLATDIRTISKVYAPASNVTGSYMFDLRYQMTLFDFFGLYFNQSGFPSGPVASYMEGMSYIKLVNDVFNYPMSFTYTRTTDRLFLETDYTKLEAGAYLMVEAYVQIDTSQYGKVWNDRVFKRYYTALLKKQWAQNLMKFSGMPLPGGASLNAAAIMQDALSELNSIEEMLKKTQELPPDPLIG
jgi:hypothetical protein